MDRRALLIGIDEYDAVRGLTGCVADARAMAALLQEDEDGSPNYDCRLLTSPGPEPVTRAKVRSEMSRLFDSFTGDVLFYFSGHGTPTELGGYLMTQDGTRDDPGIAMNDLLMLANLSRTREILLILDCCFSGSLGNPPSLQRRGQFENLAQLREGVTILAASRPSEVAVEMDGHGLFSQLVLGALQGGAADVRGQVSAASIYAYVEEALGAWDQRPLYKSHADRLSPVRRCRPYVQDELLRELPKLFPKDGRRRLDPSYEHSDESARPENVAIFDKLKVLRNARLLRTTEGKDLYFTALGSGEVELTPLGKFYWLLAKHRRI